MSELDFAEGSWSALSITIQITLESVVNVAPDQISCKLDGDAAILNLKTGAYHGLNPVGAVIWGLLERPIKVRSLLDEVLAQYNVERDVCESDLIQLLRQLHERGLIEVADGAGG